MYKTRGFEIFYACQSQQNAYLTVVGEKIELLKRRNSHLERQILLLQNFKETVTIARKEKFSARAYAKQLEKALAESKIREDTLQEQLESQVAKVSTFATIEEELKTSRQLLAAEQKAKEKAEPRMPP